MGKKGLGILLKGEPFPKQKGAKRGGSHWATESYWDPGKFAVCCSDVGGIKVLSPRPPNPPAVAISLIELSELQEFTNLRYPPPHNKKKRRKKNTNFRFAKQSPGRVPHGSLTPSLRPESHRCSSWRQRSGHIAGLLRQIMHPPSNRGG